MNEKKIMLIVFVFSLIAVLFFKFNTKKDLLKIRNIVFKEEVASSQQQKNIGLSKYNSIDEDFAMVFPFEKADYYSFWMKDMKFPIDIIYVKDDRIIQIFKNVPYPKSDNEELKIYKSKKVADSVIEIKAGISSKYNFMEGDRVEY